MKTASFWIKQLNLLKHPEGGFYKETYRSTETFPVASLPDRFPHDRHFSTAIYFLMQSQDRSLFHRIKSDELWFYHAGSSLTIHVLTDRALKTFKLGPDLDNGETLQAIIPANCWFGATVNSENSYALSSCTVSPGFDFADFELADRELLLRDFPSHSSVIKHLTD